MPLQVYRIHDFSGGRNTQSSSYDLESNESPDELNLDGSNPGIYQKRKGLKRFTSTLFGTTSMSGLYKYYKADGTSYLLGLCRINLTAEPTNSNPKIISSAFTNGSKMTFATFGDWCYMTNYTEAVQRFDGQVLGTVGLTQPTSVEGQNTIDGLVSNNGAIYYSILTGSASSDNHYTYRLTYDYGRLGESAPCDFLIELADATFQVAGNNHDGNINITVDIASQLTDSTEVKGINFYRSNFHQPASLTAGVAAAADAFPHYFSGTTTTKSGSNWTFTDNIAAAALGDPVPEKALTWPKARYVIEHRNRLFFANCYEAGETNPGPEFPSRLYFTYLYQGDRLEDFADVFQDDGDVITGVHSFLHKLLIFKRRKIYVLTGSSTSNFEIRLLAGGVGCVSHDTIQQIEGVVFWLGHDGVYTFNGAGPPQKITNKIRDDILDIKKSSLENAVGGAWQGKYYLAIEEN